MEVVAFTFAFVAVLVGAVVQGEVGYGLALVVVPVLALVQPEALPAVVLLLAMPAAGFMVREGLRFRGRAWAGLDSIGPSCRCAGGYRATRPDLGRVPLDALRGARAGGRAREPREIEDPAAQQNQACGGCSFGGNGYGGIGGPPLALVYQECSGPEIRSTLAVAFLVGTGISLATLFFVGRLEWEHLLFAIHLLPGLLLGLLGTGWVASLLDRCGLRLAVLVFAVSGLAAMLQEFAG